MPGFTTFFGLAFFDVGDNTADSNNVQREIERFTIIDSQLFGLYNVFGNGIVTGWTVTAPTTQNPQVITVNVSPGLGIINFWASQTTFQSSVQNLPPNTTFFIHAQVTGATLSSRTVNFLYSRASSVAQAQVLARVVTGNNSITSIDNTVRTQIGYQELINSLIATHHHRGSPTKIDLATETKNQLPGSQIGNIPASLINSGKLNQGVMPQIDHNSLLNRGMFTHSGLDAMARKLSGNVDQLMGTVGLVNQLRDLITMLTISAAIESTCPALAAELATYGQYWVNTIALVPGVTNATYIDFSSSDCYIGSNCISGTPAIGGQIVSVTWNSEPSWSTATTQNNIYIESAGVTVARANQNPFVVEDFSEAGTTGGALSSFTTSIQTVNNLSGVFGDNSTTVPGQNYSGDFHTQESVRVAFTKTFNAPQDWSAYNQLFLSVKAASNNHGAVYFYYQDSSGNQSSVTQILSAGQITSNPSNQNFIQISITLSGTRTAISQLVFYSDDVTDDADFWVDDIYLTTTSTYQPLGTLRVRYVANQAVTFNSLTYTATTPDVTQVNARIRVADNAGDLTNSLFTNYLPYNSSFVLAGYAAEIEFQLISSGATSQYAPTLTSATLSMTMAGVDVGITVPTSLNLWASGTLDNVSVVGGSPGTLYINPIGGQASSIGDLSFFSNGAVNELNASNAAIAAITGSDMPASEIQAWNGLNTTTVLGFNNAQAAVRTSDRSWIVCDTGNNRVAVYSMNSSGATYLAALYAGAPQDVDLNNDLAIGITATYNSNTGILWLGFSKTITILPANFSKITVAYGATSFNLSEEGDLLLQSTATSGGYKGNVIGFPLSIDHQSQLEGQTVGVTVKYTSGLAPTLFNDLFANVAVPVYFAPVTYTSLIYSPVYAIFDTDGSGRLWICNATALVQTTDASGNVTFPLVPPTRNLQLFDPTTDTGIYTNNIQFSLQFGGSILQLPSGKIMAAGLDSNLNGYVWSDALAGTPVILYQSPTNCQPTGIAATTGGYFWVSESSGTARGGRVVKVDSLGNIVASFNGAYTLINSVQVLLNNDVLIAV